MRLSVVALLATLSSLGLAQLDQLPKCAQTCFGNNLGGCNALDFKCVCSNSALIAGLSCCVSQTCTPTEQESTIKVAVQLCNAYQVSVPTSASCAASQTGASTAAPSASGASRNVTAAITSGASAASTGAKTSVSGAAASGPPSQAGSTGAAPLQTAGAGLVGVAIAGLMAAL
ncbi:uncharacterized protein BDR25DRAFT_301396 [Lindgomyces ingoldianus]|uniref:Uncharacterized protein n=1 Tax=Lindgomyces ingoldianus TaxID=673940 RepID=A0ACB6R617_9PLEO|nr:uncharacterized protein BDR25DRAFT_301396 [Lindgomyces ingoldianus]KAF2474754.1 hypothetical protein BDR25DRAFT_301396 [Lindgomyces ingoldianus]